MATRHTLHRIRRGIETLATQVLREPVRFVWAEPNEDRPHSHRGVLFDGAMIMPSGFSL
jgi:hypothetical protein